MTERASASVTAAALCNGMLWKKGTYNVHARPLVSLIAAMRYRNRLFFCDSLWSRGSCNDETDAERIAIRV
jgi:hypothetical protein